MTGVRELETRIQFMDDGAVCDVPGRPDNDYDVPGHARIMIDLMTLAFQCDQTRDHLASCSPMPAPTAATTAFLNYNGSPLSGQHHELSHHQGNTDEPRQTAGHQSLGDRAVRVPPSSRSRTSLSPMARLAPRQLALLLLLGDRGRQLALALQPARPPRRTRRWCGHARVAT